MICRASLHAVANATRSEAHEQKRKKGPFVDEKLFRKVQQAQREPRQAADQDLGPGCTIIPEFVGHTFEVHNGNKFLKVFVQEDMVGHKLGEFSPTRMFRATAVARPPRPARRAALASSAESAQSSDRVDPAHEI